MELGPGDAMIAFTDGVIERHLDSRWFDEHDLVELIATNDVGADALAGLICDAVIAAFNTPLSDDMAILVLRRQAW